MKQIIFILMTLLSFNLSAQRVNKYGQKMVNKIIFEDVWDNNKCEKYIVNFDYNTYNELKKYTIYNSYNQCWSAELIDERIILKFENKTINKSIKVDNGLIKQIVEIYGGRKEVTNYVYDDVYDTKVPYVISADYKPYFINKKGTYDLYEDDAVTWSYNYYKGYLKVNWYDTYECKYSGTVKQEAYNKDKMSQEREKLCNTLYSIENLNINITNFDITEYIRTFYKNTEWMPTGNFYFKKDIDGFNKTEFEYDNNDNLIQVKYYVIDKDDYKEKYRINIEYVQ